MIESKELLKNIFSFYGSDKSEHGYANHYVTALPDKCKYLMEIGCYKGASLKSWRIVYGKECNIHTIDLFMDQNNMTYEQCMLEGFVPYRGDQSSMDVLNLVLAQYDVVLDDGSHNAHHQLISFKKLFQHNLTSGGIYAIEDCHANKEEFYMGGECSSFTDTALYMFATFKNCGVIDNPYFTEADAMVFGNLIASVQIFDEKLILVTKK